MTAPLRVFVITGEASGDALGGALMRALRAGGREVEFSGVGGPAMQGQGLRSLFPIEDISVMGIAAVAARLPLLLRRIRETASAVVAARPDALVIVDSPDFTHRVARRVRRAAPEIAIVNYVPPTVWAWRSGRARAMAAYVDHALALMPFEVDAMRRHGGPPCSYAGHPLIEQLAVLRPRQGERPMVGQGPPTLLALPGSRRSVIARHMPLFGKTLEVLLPRLAAAPRVVIPTFPHLRQAVAEHAAGWPMAPEIVTEDEARLAAFRGAHAALASSGTVTLQLALAGVPMVAAYLTEPMVKLVRPFFTYNMPSFILPNLILGENAVPEFIERETRSPEPAALAAELGTLLADTPERRAQVAALSRMEDVMRLDNGESPSVRAARIVLETIMQKKRAA